MGFRKVSLLLLYDDNGNILIQNRMNLAKNKNIPKKFVADYGLFGGGIEEGETPEQALAREMIEELEIDVNKLENLEFFKRFEYQIPEIDIQRELYVYMAKMPKINNIVCHEGSAEIFKIQDAMKLNISDRDKKTIKELSNKLKISS